MSKLIFLISLIGFIAIEAVAGGTPPKTNNSTPGYGFPSSSFGPKQPSKVTIPCQTNHPDCLAQKNPPRKTSSAPSSGEDKIKDNCYKQSGNSYGDKYQECLASNGIFHVNRNINGDDKSQSDARLCYTGDKLCDRCLRESKNAATLRERRNQTQACLEAGNKPVVATPKPKTTPKQEETPVDEIVVEGRLKCEVGTPFKCKTEATCKAVNGVWNGTACAIAPCAEGSTADAGKDPGNLCKCDSDENYWIERGTPQVCPSSCSADDHKVYNLVARSCLCTSGYEMRTGSTTCVSTAAPQPNVAACIRDLQEKATSCNTAATTAVNKCDADNKSTSGDTIGVMQNLLQGAGSIMQASGASDNCATIAIAGSTGYYALDALKATCDTEIGTCRSTCTDANTYITANKQKAYEKCRRDAFDNHLCTINSPYRAPQTQEGETAFNAEYDGINKAKYDEDIQHMLTTVADNNTKCESGTAVTNRDKMMGYLDEANNTAKSANQCQCQLSSGSGGDCSKAPGPAECAANPSLSGCAQVTVNCLSATDNSPKCACFKNPNSNECKNIASNLKATIGNTGASAFAGASATGKQSSLTGFGGDGGVNGKTGSTDVSGDLSGINSDEVAAGSASGTVTPDGGSPFGSAGGSGSLGGGGQGGNGSDGSAAGNTNGDNDGSGGKGIRGFFETAKSAIGGLFKGKKDDNGNYTGADGITRDANGNPIGAANKWRPRGMVRGLAGNETEIAGKFEDIWKVMNKQYKVQDQKDSFIFGEKN